MELIGVPVTSHIKLEKSVNLHPHSFKQNFVCHQPANLTAYEGLQQCVFCIAN